MLGLSGTAKKEAFEQLCDNINPLTEQSLTPKTVDGRRVGWDFNFNAVKSVSIARELAVDPRIEAAHREAVDYAMKHVEKDFATRVRVGGKDEDRITGNLVGMHVIHRTTRPNKQDGLPDMALHSHVVIFNATFDAVEDKWKAGQIGEIKHDACYYEALYANRLAHNLKNLGYGIRRKEKAFEIEGVSEELIRKFSRRTETIKETQKAIEEKYGTEMGEEAKAKFGATTRLHKVDIREDPLRDYWVSRLTAEEKQQLKGLIGKPSYQSSDPKAVQYAIGHMFERNSVVDERKLYETAIRHGIGSVTPEGVKAEAKRQGLLVKGKEATTKQVLAEEGRIIAYAREGRGTMRPLGLTPKGSEQAQPATLSTVGQQKGDVLAAGRMSPVNAVVNESNVPGRHPHRTPATPPPPATQNATLSKEQQAVCQHIWSSPDRVIMIEGDAGTGKTQTMQRTIPGIDKPGVFLAPSASASRGTLREKGFTNADTIAKFLENKDFREQARDGYIYIDEAPLAGLSDVAKVFDHAKDLNARVIIQGDRKQHKSVQRGNLFPVLEKYAGLPIGRLTENWRQTNKQYKEAVKAIAKGDILAGYDKLEDLGWVKETDTNKPLVDEYIAGLAAKKEMLIVAPTHKEGDELTADIRARLKQEGKLGDEERTFDQLVPLHWTDAERGDRFRYTGDEVIQFTRSIGPYKAGQRVGAGDVLGGDELPSSKSMAVYRPGTLVLAQGDTIRITANGWTLPDAKGNKHRLDNGSEYTVEEFTEQQQEY